MGGGVIRDVLTGERPMVLVGQIYALAGIVGGCLFVTLIEVGVNTQFAVWLSVLLIIAIRLISIRPGMEPAEGAHRPTAHRLLTEDCGPGQRSAFSRSSFAAASMAVWPHSAARDSAARRPDTEMVAKSLEMGKP